MFKIDFLVVKYRFKNKLELFVCNFHKFEFFGKKTFIYCSLEQSSYMDFSQGMNSIDKFSLVLNNRIRPILKQVWKADKILQVIQDAIKSQFFDFNTSDMLWIGFDYTNLIMDVDCLIKYLHFSKQWSHKFDRFVYYIFTR